MGSSSQSVQEDPSSESLPRRFGRYLLFDRIGRGGMADIYLARVETELGVGRRMVIKQILRELSGDAHFARMLVDEAKLVAGLRHANIAQVLDLGREDDRLFIAMEYVEGFDLNQLLRTLSRRRIALPAEFALFVVREMLAALDFAHRATDESGRPLALVHRDVSPSNVLISFEGEIKLCDFGIAKAFGAPGSSLSPQGLPASDAHAESSRERSRIAGKAAYMAPEHARGEELDARADVYAAGIVLWELCAGRRLHRGTEAEMLAHARAGRVPPLPDRGLPLQAELSAVLDRALALAPEDRFSTAAEMLRAIDEYAIRAKLFASQLRFASFLSEHFEADVVALRRDRERAAQALERGPAVQLDALDDPEAAPSPAPTPDPTTPVEPDGELPLAPETEHPADAEQGLEKAATPAEEHSPLPTAASRARGFSFVGGALVVVALILAWLLSR